MSMASNGHHLSFLIIESEPGQGLSTRKLLLESAKHNVITAYSGKEGIEMFKRFPNVDAICIDAELNDFAGSDVASKVRKNNPKIRIVGLSPRLAARCDWADQTIDSHDPAALLELLEEMGGRTDI
jgi:CheY-like chemotaxis protein